MAHETNTDWNAQAKTTQATPQDDVSAMEAAVEQQQAQAAAGNQSYGPTNNTQYQQGYQDSRKMANEVPHIFTLLNKLETQASLSENGRKYYEKLRAALEDHSWSAGNEITCIRLTSPAEAVMLYSKNTNVGIILVFIENMLDGDDEESITRAYGVARQCAYDLMKSKPGFRIINVIGVDKEDYDKVDVMITDLKNSFISDTDILFTNMTVDALSRLQLSVSLMTDKVAKFVSINSPHGVPAPFDFGFTVDVVVPRSQNTRFMLENNARREYETKTIAAITAKTTFLANPAGRFSAGFNNMSFNGIPENMKFIPVVSITDIISPIKTPNMLPLYLTLAYQVLIGGGYWKTPFRQFGKPRSVNVGNLLENQQTHQLLEITNDVDLETFFARYCKFPIMILDSTEGRSRIPGIEWFSDPSLVKFAGASFAKFFQQPDGNTFQVDPVVLRHAEYHGPMTYDGKIVDSRSYDYLRAVADNPTDAPNLQALLNLSVRPADKAKFMRSVSSDYHTKYITMECAIRHEFLTAVGSILNKYVHVQQDIHGNGPNYMNLEALINESNQYATSGFGMMGTGAMGANYNFNNFFAYPYGN